MYDYSFLWLHKVRKVHLEKLRSWKVSVRKYWSKLESFHSSFKLIYFSSNFRISLMIFCHKIFQRLNFFKFLPRILR